MFALTLPEPAGIGLSMAEAVVVFEELGRALVPGPLVGTFLAARAGVVEGAAEGRAQVGVHCRGAGSDLPDLVEHLGSLDALLVFAADGRGAATLLDRVSLDGVVAAEGSARVDAPLDPLTPLWRIDTLPAGEPVAGDVGALWRDGALLTAALQVGHAAEALDLAVAYAKERQQFGTPIGSFQAVKHMCADMLVRAEVARAAVHAAACLADAPDVVDTEAAVAGCTPGQLVDRVRRRRQAAGRRSRAGQRPRSHSGLRGHGLHVGGAAAPASQAGAGAVDHLRHPGRARHRPGRLRMIGVLP